MALEKKTQEIKFRVGLGQAEDTNADPNGFLEFQNAVYNAEGKLQRRHGFRRQAASGLTTTGLLKANGNLGVLSSTSLKAYDPNASFANVATVSTDSITTRTYDKIDRGYNLLRTDVAFLFASATLYLAVLSVERNDNTGRTRIRERYYNYTLGTVIYDGDWLVIDSAESVRRVRCVANTALGVFTNVAAYVRGGSVVQYVSFRSYNPVANTFTSTVDLTTDASMLTDSATSPDASTKYNIHSSPAMDACYFNGLTYVTWIDKSEGKAKVQAVDASATSGSAFTSTDSPLNVETNDYPSPLALEAHGSNLVLVFLTASAMKSETINPSGMVSVATGTTASTASTAGGNLTLMYVDGTTIAALHYLADGNLNKFPITVSTATIGSATTYRGLQPLSRGLPSLPYVLTTGPQSSTYADVFLTSLASATPTMIRRFVFENAAQDIIPGSPSSVAVSPSGDYAVFLPYAIDSEGAMETKTADGIVYETLRHAGVVLVSSVDDSPAEHAYIQDVPHIAGTIPRVFTGTEVLEAGLLGPPPKLTLAAASGSSHTADEAYSYLPVGTQSDEMGRIYTSAPGAAVSITPTGGNLDVTVGGASYGPLLSNATATNARRRLEVYRTAGNGALYNLLHGSNLNSGLSIASFEDEQGDAAVEARKALYTVSGGPLESEPPPPSRALWAHRNRLMAAREDMPSQVRYTQESSPPDVPRWHSVLQKNLGTDIVAGASLGGGCVLFASNAIYAFAGEGPDGNGLNDSFTAPEPLATGVGARDAIGVVQCPEGVMFRATTGIYLLSGGGAPTFIGAPVQRLEAAMGATTAAAYLPSINQTWFAGASGALLVYDHQFQRWSSFTFPGSTGSTYMTGIVELDGFVYSLLRNGDLYRYDTATYCDHNGSAAVGFDSVVSVPWFRPAGYGGNFRVWWIVLEIVAVANSTDVLAVQTYTYQPHRQIGKVPDLADGTQTFTQVQLDTLPEGMNTLRVRPKVQRCESFRCRITLSHGTSPDSTEAGMGLLGLKYEYGVQSQLGKSPLTPGSGT